MEEQKNETGCCPRFNPEPWEDKILNWDNKRFIRDKVKCLFYMPLNFGQVMQRLDKKNQCFRSSDTGLFMSCRTSIKMENGYFPGG